MENLGRKNKSMADYIINDEAQPGKNSTLHKTHKEGNLMRLLTTGFNTTKENFPGS